jgi:nucleotide-binding universal stress UspA family protein
MAPCGYHAGIDQRDPGRNMANAASLILLPTDGSASSVRAAQHCAMLARALGASVLLLNVQPEVEDWQTHGIGREAALDHLRSLAAQATAQAAAALKGAGVAFETLIEHGDASEVIAQVVASRGCSSVVMGTRGQGGVKNLLLGSVGAKVIHLVEVPVTFVH